MRRLTGQHLKTFVAGEIAGPLGADFQIGAREAGWDRNEQSHGPDLVLGVPLRFGIGYALPETETVPYAPQGRTCYWGGWGGSVIMMDLDAGATISYVMNKIGPGVIGSDRSEVYVRVIRDCLA